MTAKKIVFAVVVSVAIALLVRFGVVLLMFLIMPNAPEREYYDPIAQPYISEIEQNMAGADETLIKEMEQETDPIMEYAHQIFNGEIPAEETEGTPLDRYNVHHDLRAERVATIEYQLERLGVWLEGNEGMLWVRYSIRWFDSNEDRIYSSLENNAIWILEKYDEVWTVTDVKVGP
jgi:hypothetical protein